MLTEYPLNIPDELAYAEKWAYARNPAFYNFDAIGGDCTNFVSQCLYAGGAVMNFTTNTGWYYVSPQDRAAAWTSVEYFYRFLVNNQGVGPFGREIPVSGIVPGDVIQLGDGSRFYHSLFVVSVWQGEPLVATHSVNSYLRPLSSYTASAVRGLHVIGARRYP